MALISCPECDKPVSNSATACPHCAFPLQPEETGFTQPKVVVTTQATSKHFKGIQLLGAILIGIGVVSCSAGDDSHTFTLWMVIGFLIYVSGRVGAWWHHG